MNKNQNPFKSLQEICRKVAGARGDKHQIANINRLRTAIRTWAGSGDDTETKLFTDSIHAAADINHLGNPLRAYTRVCENELYTITDDSNGQVVMTGAQLTSLALQWAAWRAGKLPLADGTINTKGIKLP